MKFNEYKHIDPRSLWETVGGDGNAVAALAGTYLDSAPGIFAKLLLGIANVDCKAVQHDSHTLKGMAGILGAQGLVDALLLVEQAARRGGLPDVIEQGRLTSLFEMCLAEVRHCVRSNGAAA